MTDDQNELSQRLEQLLSKRGQELVGSLVDEFKSLHRQIAALRREISALADYQASRWLVLEAGAASAIPLPRTVVLEPDQLLRTRDGFYPVEYTSAGVPFRWTGPSVQFSFDLFVDRVYGADLHLHALNCVDFERQKDLSLFVDAESVAVEIVQEGTGFVVSAVLPSRADSRASNLVFVLPEALVPVDSAEIRSLGIAFGRLSVIARSSEDRAPAPDSDGKPERAARRPALHVPDNDDFDSEILDDVPLP